MKTDATQTLFGAEHAASYDKNFAKLAPFRDVLFLATRLALAPVPRDANALCVGAGTGLELGMLAEAYPDWRFTLVEPAPAMMAQCRRRADQLGIADRCTFHEGYLETLDPTPRFHAATALLVSQFLTEPDQRRAFFAGIADRLLAQGLLVSADLALDQPRVEESALWTLWKAAMRFNGQDEAGWRNYVEKTTQHVALATPDAIETLIAEAGFEPPVRICQAALIHGWSARKAAQG